MNRVDIVSFSLQAGQLSYETDLLVNQSIKQSHLGWDLWLAVLITKSIN